jgi:hypothetical protein
VEAAVNWPEGPEPRLSPVPALVGNNQGASKSSWAAAAKEMPCLQRLTSSLSLSNSTRTN